MMGHLKAEDFVDSLEGGPLDARQAAHLQRCGHCRETLASIAPYFRDVSDPERPNLDVASPDWYEVRSSVRDQLLARAVRRSSAVSRWSGYLLRPPAAAWGAVVPILVIAVMMVLAGLWHYRTTPPPSLQVGNGTPVETMGTDFVLFMDDPTALETEALAWSDPEIFIALNELEESEEETLLELISLTFAEDDGV